jgi:Icc-related predicted phosphoesterase
MAKVRIVALGDTHGRHREVDVPEGDILVHTGDFMASGEDFREIIDFNFWLSEQRVETSIVIAGNHDLLLQKQRYFARSFLSNAIYLENSGYHTRGIRFWGSPYTPEFMGWAFMAERGEAIDRYWKMIPSSTDVLVTHGPPFGYLDVYESRHVGCEMLANELKRRNISVNIFGHIHPGFGQARLGETRLYNVAIPDENKEPTHPVTVIDIENYL